MSDVRDILQLHSAEKNGLSKDKKNKKKSRRLIEQAKRPQGVHREVWGLINKDDSTQPPLIPTDEPKLYKHPKAKLRRGVRKWHWVAFKNPARQDTAEFYHWRCVNDDPNKEYPFAKYNKKVNVARYSDAEYEQYLKDEPAWSKEETDHLFELCQAYDLRFFIVHDRWDPARFAGAKTRSIDELKDRYYKVTGIMQKLKTGCDDSQIYTFDLEHEQKRREQLEKLFNRTKEQVDEELYLIEELKKIEVRKKERERKQQEVDKLLTAVGDLETTTTTTVTSSTLFNRNNRASLSTMAAPLSSQQKRTASTVSRSVSSSNKQRRGSDRESRLGSSSGGLNTSWQATTPNGGSAANSLNNSADGSLNQSASPTALGVDKNKKGQLLKTPSESGGGVGATSTGGIRFPDTKTAGVSLRSFKVKLPPSVGQRKQKAIETVLDELHLDARPPMATEAICEQFNELRSDVVLLYELYQALSAQEYELQTLRHRYESVLLSKNIDLAQFEMPTQTSQLVNTLIQANNTPQKRNAEILDPGLNQQTGPLERRRKAAINQTNLIKRLRGRNAT